MTRKSPVLAVLFGLSAGMAVATTASAEFFVNRGENWATSAPRGEASEPARVNPSADTFNLRGDNFVAEAPAGSAAPREGVVTVPSGFNDRSRVR